MAEDKSKVKKKRWVQIVAPPLFRNEVVGEVPVIESKSLVGKLISVNLMTLTRDIKKQNASLKFTVTGVKGDVAHTQLYGYYLNPTSIKRMVRRGKEKVQLSSIFKTSDGKRIRLMPLMIPRNKVRGSVGTSLKKSAISHLGAVIAKMTFENIIKECIIGKLQRELKNELKKVYPVRILDISKLHIEQSKKPVEVKEEVVEEKVEEAKKETKEEKAAETKEEKKEEKTEKKEEVKEAKEEPAKEEDKK